MLEEFILLAMKMHAPNTERRNQQSSLSSHLRQAGEGKPGDHLSLCPSATRSVCCHQKRGCHPCESQDACPPSATSQALCHPHSIYASTLSGAPVLARSARRHVTATAPGVCNQAFRPLRRLCPAPTGQNPRPLRTPDTGGTELTRNRPWPGR